MQPPIVHNNELIIAAMMAKDLGQLSVAIWKKRKKIKGKGISIFHGRNHRGGVSEKSETEANVDVRRPTSDPKRMRILDQRPNECGFLDVRRPTSGFGSTVHKGVSLSNDMNTRNRGTSILLYGQVGERDSAEWSTSKLHFCGHSLTDVFLFCFWMMLDFLCGCGNRLSWGQRHDCRRSRTKLRHRLTFAD